MNKFDLARKSSIQEKNPNQLVSIGDLQEFKEELLLSIGMIVQNKSPRASKKWLKSSEVMKLLKVSSGTLQTLRNNKTLPCTKVGGLMFYDQDEIEKVLSGEKKLEFQIKRRR
jgi:Helix-turn-helix domain